MLKTVENYVSDFVQDKVKKELEMEADERKKWYSLEKEKRQKWYSVFKTEEDVIKNLKFNPEEVRMYLELPAS
jgi:hypothetical protein